MHLRSVSNSEIDCFVCIIVRDTGRLARKIHPVCGVECLCGSHPPLDGGFRYFVRLAPGVVNAAQTGRGKPGNGCVFDFFKRRFIDRCVGSVPAGGGHAFLFFHSPMGVLEWVGVFAPLVLFWWFSRMTRTKPGSGLRVVSQALIIYGCFYFLASLVLTIPARLQPMRSLHLLYVFLILIGGGLLGAHVLKRHAWRWILLFAPLCGGMWFAQRQLFPGSPHIEWPGAAPSNDWQSAFEWFNAIPQPMQFLRSIRITC